MMLQLLKGAKCVYGKLSDVATPVKCFQTCNVFEI